MFSFLRKKKEVPLHVPSLQELEQYSENVRYTPDTLLLERRAIWNVFVFDNLMKGKVNNALLGEDQVRHNWAFTKDHFTLWHKDEGRLSTVIPLEETHKFAPFALVKGEIVSVRTQQIINVLDKTYENGVRFARKRVKLYIPFSYGDLRDPKTRVSEPFLSETEAWMYVGSPDFWGPMVRKKGATVRHWDKEANKVTTKLFYDKSSNTLLTPASTYLPHNKLLERYSFFTGIYERDTSQHS